jgi:hypothetical protein
MSRLIDMLKESVNDKKNNVVSKKNNVVSKKNNGDDEKSDRIHPDYDNDKLEPILRAIGFTLDEYKKILDRVNSRVIPDDKLKTMTHRKYELEKYGWINRSDGKSFMIPGLQVGSEDYVYQYAHFMGILVNNPERFLKIMNWE